MRSFEFYAPTKVVFGPGTEERAGELVRDFGGTKALVHFGGQSAKRSGVLDRVISSLEAAGIEHVELGGVRPNPHISLVREGVKFAKENGVDFIVAVGGGSVIDSSKAIAYGVADPEGGDPWDFYDGLREPVASIPVGVVLTIAGAGSEMSGSSVITEAKTGKKRAVKSDLCKPKFACMNPELTLTVPAQITASCNVDILMHTMERYFTSSEKMFLTDGIAESLMRTVVYNARALAKNPQDISARTEIMLCSTWSHNDMTGPVALADFACHQLEHELSGMFNVPHGAGLAAIWGTWARYVVDEDPTRFARFAIKVVGLGYNPESTKALALQGIEAVEELFKQIGMPTCIKDLGIDPSEGQLKSMARSCSRGGTRTIGSFKKLDEADMLAIYKKALG